MVELTVSLALFGLIAVAGLALVDGVIGIERRTTGRLDRIADLQRADYVVTTDLMQIAPGRIAGGGADLSFMRAIEGRTSIVRYALAADGARRTVTAPGLAPMDQALLPGAGALRFRFWTRAEGWRDRWPPDATRADERPEAIEMTIAPPGTAGPLRRLVALPARP